MISFDTNILFAWLNKDHAWHAQAAPWVAGQHTNESAILCELVLVELYGLLRNPVLLKEPLDAPQAVQTIRSLRCHPRWILVDYPGSMMEAVWDAASSTGIARRRIYDARLALTLRHHGVTEFATTNIKDFQYFGFQRVWNPLIEPS